MRIFTCLLLLSLFTFQMNAQRVLVDAPASISGCYEFLGTDAFGGDLSSVTITAEAIFVDDGTANPTEACSPVINGMDLAGKIALIDRGNCAFVTKFLNAQNAGAIAGIVFNNLPDAPLVNMSGDDPNITIPCIFMSFEDGQAIRQALDDGETVTISMGDVNLDFDLTTGTDNVEYPLSSTVALNQIEAPSNYVVPISGIFDNIGAQSATNLRLKAEVTYQPTPADPTTVVYADSGTAPMLEPDSAVLIVLDSFVVDSMMGLYNITYTASSDNPDQCLSNGGEGDFSILLTVDDNAISMATWDYDADLPEQTTAIRPSNNTTGYEVLMGFDVANGLGHQLDSVTFYAGSLAGDSLGGVSLIVSAYEWRDLDADDAYDNDELSLVGTATTKFADQDSTEDTYVTLPITDLQQFDPGYPFPGDNLTYVVGVRHLGSEEVFIGFDGNTDRSAGLFRVGFPRQLDYPYLVVDEWVDNGNIPDVDNADFIFTDFGASAAIVAHVNALPVNVNNNLLEENEGSLSLYPNPVMTELNAEIDLQERTSFLNYRILDTEGRVVRLQRVDQNLDYHKMQLNVSDLPAGQYFLHVNTDQGAVVETFTVVR